MKYVYFDFPNGETWRVPARLIADDRADYYAEKDHPDDVEAQREAKAIERDFALNDEVELFDWLRNNMDWGDVEPHATRIDGPQPVEKGDFYNNADLRLEEVDPNDDPDKPEGIPRGVYLLADTPLTRHPLLTEADDGDHALLREAIEEGDVDGIEVTHGKPSYDDVVESLHEALCALADAHKRANNDAHGDRCAALMREIWEAYDVDTLNEVFDRTDHDHDESNDPLGSPKGYDEVREYILSAVEDAEGGDGAPVPDVIDAAANEYSLGATLDVLRHLHRTGEVYGPTRTTLRTTGYEPGE